MQSAAFRAMGLNAAYLPLACAATEVACLMKSLVAAGGGGNVTLPHKVAAAASVDRLSETARSLGACNTFFGRNGELWGDNTDVVGVAGALGELGAPASSWHVIGTGGAARAVVEVARTASAAVSVSSRSQQRARQFAGWASERGVTVSGSPEEAEVVINATPLGLSDADDLPLEPAKLPAARFALDLVYRPGRTRWIRIMRQRGATAEDGRAMLVAQGAAAFRCWFPEVDPPVDIMRAAAADALR